MRRSRPVLFGAVLTAHLLLIVLIATWRAPQAPPPGERMLVVAQLVRPVPPPPPPPPPRLRTAAAGPAAPPPPPPAPAPPLDFSACATIAAVQAALTADPRVQQILAAIPAETRSVSNSVTLWDGAWADAAAPGPLDPLRGVLADAVAGQPPECLDQPLLGPRLFIVAEDGGQAPVSLVIGSGSWRWRDVVAPVGPASGDGTPRQASIGSYRRG